jgi:hypothetical protein
MSIIRHGALVLLLLGTGTYDVAAKELTAGVAPLEVTPPVGSPMGGYRLRPSVGVHDPLYATVLVLKSGGMTVAIIGCDLRSFPSERIVTPARERKLADHVLIAVTHNQP